jgi:cytoskeleton protein RodZ
MQPSNAVLSMSETGTNMSAEWSEQPDVPADLSGIPGKTLAAQREAMGWSVEQVADQLKLAVRQVVAIEAGDYAALPGPAVVRGFIRAYAKVVKLDPVPLVALIPLDTPGPTDATATTLRREKPASFNEVRFPSNGKRPSVPYGAIGAVVVVVAAAFGAWHFGLLPSGLLHSGTPAASASASAAAAAAADKPAPSQLETTLVKPEQDLKPVETNSVPLISVPPVAGAGTPGNGTPAGVTPAGGAPPAGAGTPVAGTPAPVVAAPGAAPLISPVPSQASGGANPLVITVREDSWIEVRRAKGAPLIARLVKAGETETFDVSEPVTLKVGKPSGVNVTLRGAAVDLPPLTNSTISRVNLK